MNRNTETINIELTAEERDALILILNSAREQLVISVNYEVYKDLLKKIGNVL